MTSKKPSFSAVFKHALKVLGAESPTANNTTTGVAETQTPYIPPNTDPAIQPVLPKPLPAKKPVKDTPES